MPTWKSDDAATSDITEASNILSRALAEAAPARFKKERMACAKAMETQLFQVLEEKGYNLSPYEHDSKRKFIDLGPLGAIGVDFDPSGTSALVSYGNRKSSQDNRTVKKTVHMRYDPVAQRLVEHTLNEEVNTKGARGGLTAIADAIAYLMKNRANL